MFSNKVWGLSYSPSKLLSLCCGFFSSSSASSSERGSGSKGGKFDDDGGGLLEGEGEKNEDRKKRKKKKKDKQQKTGEGVEEEEEGACAGAEEEDKQSIQNGGVGVGRRSQEGSLKGSVKGSSKGSLKGSVKGSVKGAEAGEKERKDNKEQAVKKEKNEENKKVKSKESVVSNYGAVDKADETLSADGSAYQYHDSSSDSDDEVLKHYQGLKKSGSFRGSTRSGKSGRTARSAKSDTSSKRGGPRENAAGPSEDDDACLAEEGRAPGGGDVCSQGGEETVAGTSRTTPLDSPLIPRSIAGGTPAASDAAGLSDAGGASGAGSGGGVGVTYDNQAFTGTRAVSGSASDGSDHGLATDILSTNDEHLFDVSDLQHEPPLISKCGSLEVTFTYDNAKSKMTVTVHKAREIPAKDRGGANSTQVRVMLLPTKKQRFKTKVKEGQDPAYDETFTFSKVTPDEVPGMGLRFRLYGLERMRRERMIGESVIGFASLNLDEPTTHWVILEPRSNLSHGDSGFDVASLSKSDSASSTQSLQHGGMPELLMGLAYNGTTGRLAVQVIKGSNFRNMAMNRPPDTYVKVTLMSPTGQELQRCKTSVRRGQPNPLFKETFMLQVALFQLPDVTLMVSVYNKKSMKKKEMIGWFSLGQNSSGEEENSHWTDMRESKGEEVCRWHVLLES